MKDVDYLHQILDSIGVEFLIAAEEEFRFGCERAYDLSERIEGRPLQPYYLGQLRHVERQEALRRTAEAAGERWRDAAHGYPRVVVEAGALRILETKVRQWGDPPKVTEFSRDLARANPNQGIQLGCLPFPDLLRPAEPLLAYVVVVMTSESEPVGLGIGIPTANLDDWVELKTFNQLLQAHADRTRRQVVTDEAYPKLGGRRRREQEDSEDSNNKN